MVVSSARLLTLPALLLAVASADSPVPMPTVSPTLNPSLYPSLVPEMPIGPGVETWPPSPAPKFPPYETEEPTKAGEPPAIKWEDMSDEEKKMIEDKTFKKFQDLFVNLGVENSSVRDWVYKGERAFFSLSGGCQRRIRKLANRMSRRPEEWDVERANAFIPARCTRRMNAAIDAVWRRRLLSSFKSDDEKFIFTATLAVASTVEEGTETSRSGVVASAPAATLPTQLAVVVVLFGVLGAVFSVCKRQTKTTEENETEHLLAV